MNKYFKNYLLYTINIVMMFLFPIVTFPYVSRVLGPSKLGVINFAQSYGYYFNHIASFGISSYAIREVSRVRDKKDIVERVACEIFNLNFFFSCASFLLYILGMIIVKNFRDNYIVFLLYSLVIFTNFLTLDWLLQSYDDYFFSTVRNFLIRLFALILVFVLVKKEDDYILYMLISCMSEMGTKISTLIHCRRRYVKLRLRIGFLNFRTHIKSMFTLFAFRLVNGISANLDKLMIGFMMLYTDVGVYSAGIKFVMMIWPVVETAGVVLFPKINISADRSQEEYKKLLKVNYNLILVIGIPMAVGMILVSNRLIPMFAGDNYRGAISISRIMSLLIVIGPIADLLGSKVLLVFNKDRWLLRSSALVAITNIILNTIMIPMFGINGAAMASVISYMVAVLSRLYYARKLVDINLINKELTKYLLCTLPFLLIYLLNRNLIDTSNFAMFAFVAICCVLYTLELIITKDQLVYVFREKVFK